MSGNLFSADISVMPLKKPIFDKETKGIKISQNFLKPKSKPSKKEIKTETTTVKKDIKKINFLIPKNKPLSVKKAKSVVRAQSKHYSQKDYDIAKKSIQAMEKRQWTKALSRSKKAKDKSIHNFINWRYLLTTGNSASFYDYKIFIDQNKNYPRIGRLKYLAEHKLSTAKISPKKIINWFGEDVPLSGYGKMILGESHTLTGSVAFGTKLIKEGWINAELSKNELIFFRKKFIKN